MEYICFILAVFLIVFMTSAIYYMNKSKKVSESEQEPTEKDKNEPMPYRAAKLLTKREYAFFKSLQPIALKYNLMICPKIRLADLVEIPSNASEKNRWFNYVKCKHVDFVICDINLNVRLIIELDDSTHDKPERKQRDDFVDRIFKTINIKLLHIRQWDTNLETVVCEYLGIQNSTLNV